MRRFTLSSGTRRIALGLTVAAVAFLSAAALAGRDELAQCEAALRAALPDPDAYFRIGYRMTQGGRWRRNVHLVFFAPAHGLAVCHLRRREGVYELRAIDVQMTLPGRAPAPVP